MRIDLERGVWVEFFDRFGDPSSIYNATSFLLVTPRHREKFTFPNITWSVKDKQDFVLYRYLRAFAWYYDQVQKIKKKRKPKIKGKKKGKIAKREEIEEFIEELHEEEDLSSNLYEDLISEVKKSDPSFGKELEQEIIQRLLAEEVGEIMVKDLLKTEFPDAVIAPYEFELFSVANEQWADVEKVYFTLKEPIKIEEPNSQFMFDFFNEDLEPYIRAITESFFRKGENQLLFRMTYDYMKDGILQPSGIGTARDHTDFDRFTDRLQDKFKDLLTEKKFEKYLKTFDEPAIYLTGFTIENMYRFKRKPG